MRVRKWSVASAILRIGVLFCLGVFILGSMAVGILQGTFLNNGIDDYLTAKAGQAQWNKSGSESHRPVYLNGEWEYYPHVLVTGDTFDSRILAGKQVKMVELPVTSVKQAVGPATYRLLLHTEESLEGYAFYLENYNEDFAIFVNGQKVPSVRGGQQENAVYTLSEYLFRIDFPVEQGKVEIIISANNSQSQALLYQNEIVFGQADDVVDYAAYIWRDSTFLIGIILVLVMVGLVFTLMRTKFDMLSSITMFDTFLVIRILLGFNIATYFIHQIFLWAELSAVDFARMQYAVFFCTGAFGCLLSQSIFDPQRKLATWPIRTQMTISAAGGLFTLFFYQELPQVCIGLLFFLLVGSFLIVTWHVVYLFREKRFNRYYGFQILKTYFIGIVMALDILYLQGESYHALVYAYVAFFFAHLLARLIDNNASYKEAEDLNRNLEQMIAERTHELTEANERLSELSVRDPLTRAHNRLYFEERMKAVLEEQGESSIYLCMFDLDFFKTINDRFGHAAGDEQLKFVVNAVKEILEKNGMLFRVGGEEFVILFVNKSREETLSTVESIRKLLEEDAKANEKHTTASFGVVKYHPSYTPKDFMRLADGCLYSAKKLGRNCIVTK